MERTSILFAIFALFIVGINANTCMEKCHQLTEVNGWDQLNEAEEHTLITLTVAIKMNNIELAERLFWEVSDPYHENYGNYLSWEECRNMTRPNEETQQVVVNWLNNYKHEGMEIVSSGDYIHVHLSVKEAKKMLNTKFYEYLHPRSLITMIRSPGPYYVPEEVAQVIDFVGGVIRLPKIRSMKVNKRSTEMRQFGQIDPTTIKSYFGMPPNISGSNSNNSQAVAQFDVYAQYLSLSDLALFQSTFDLLQQQPIIKGDNNETEPGTEAMLDIEYIMGVGQNITTWFVTTNGTADGGQEPFLAWIVGQKNDPNSPWVHSVSYGDTESTVSYDYGVRVNQEMMLMGLTGRTVSFSSGDDGTGCTADNNAFAPNFPASSPYVTSVGGITTEYFGDGFEGDSISSGGFSNYWEMPSYQTEAVQAYLSNSSNNLPPSSFFNATSRAFPDISSFSENVIVYVDGIPQPVGGTSCASPVISGIFALLNDMRMNMGKPTLGFMNPTLYALLAKDPESFIDITSGNNQDCDSQAGFNAGVGWDPITGVGAPNFPNLAKFVAGIAK